MARRGTRKRNILSQSTNRKMRRSYEVAANFILTPHAGTTQGQQQGEKAGVWLPLLLSFHSSRTSLALS